MSNNGDFNFAGRVVDKRRHNIAENRRVLCVDEISALFVDR